MALDAQPYFDNSDDLSSFTAAAELYLTGAGIKKDESNELYCLAVKMLATHWKDNKGVTGPKDRLALGVDSIISQLKNQPEVTT